MVKYLKRTGITQVISLGDQVGYNTFPNEVLCTLWDLDAKMLRGNHEDMILGKIDMSYYRDDVLAPCLWNREQLSLATLEELEDLPYLAKDGDLWFVHGTPVHPADFCYITERWQAEASFRYADFKICFFGHSHVAEMYSQAPKKGVQNLEQKDARGWIQLDPESRYLINPGSVGQPRDRDPRLSFMLYDVENARVRWVRLPYDVAETQKGILEAGLPELASQRLEKGR